MSRMSFSADGWVAGLRRRGAAPALALLLVLAVLASAQPAAAQNVGQSVPADAVPGSGAWGDEIRIVPVGGWDFSGLSLTLFPHGILAANVTFNGTPARITAFARREVRAIVPNGATRGKVQVFFYGVSQLGNYTPGLAESRWEFHVTDPSLVRPRLTQVRGLGNNAISLTWSDTNAQEDGFKVYVSDITTMGTRGPWHVVTFPAGASRGTILNHLAPDVPILPGSRYDVTMTAFTSRGESLFSNYIQVTTPPASITIGASANSPIPMGSPSFLSIRGFLDVDRDGLLPRDVIRPDPPNGLFPRFLDASSEVRLELLRGSLYDSAAGSRADVIVIAELPGPSLDHVQYLAVHLLGPRPIIVSAGDLIRRDGRPLVLMLAPEARVTSYDYIRGRNGEPDRVVATVEVTDFFAQQEQVVMPGGETAPPFQVQQTIIFTFDVALEPA